MNFKTTTLLGLLLTAAAFALAAALYSHLPASMPSHWNTVGQVNGYLPRFWGTFLLPIIMVAVWCVLSMLPSLAPGGFRLDSFKSAYGTLCLAILAVLFIINLLVLFAARGGHLPMQHLIPVIAGMLLIVVGNYLGKLGKNFFAGIRTPWTLASDEVWARTHRLGGWIFVIAGCLFVIAGLFAPSKSVPYILIVVILVLLVISYGSSYFFYRRVESSGEDHPIE